MVINTTTRPVIPFFLSWRISHIKKAKRGIAKTIQKINEGPFINQL